MPVWDIAAKDLLQIIRDRKTLFFLVLMPLIFTVFLGFLMPGGSGLPSAPVDSRLPLGVLNQDPGSVLSATLLQELQALNAVRLVDLGNLVEDQARQQVQQGTLAGLLEIPSGFSEQAFAGQAVPPALVTDSGSINSQGVESAVNAVVMRLNSMLETASLSADSYASVHPFNACCAPA